MRKSRYTKEPEVEMLRKANRTLPRRWRRSTEVCEQAQYTWRKRLGELAAGNHRNGYPHKSVTLADERVVLDIPRDRNGPTIRGAVHARN